ncbi:DoxX-like protein [Paenibacillus nuruki]|nr:DoxX-like protein [Paenibacillus nuruki]
MTGFNIASGKMAEEFKRFGFPSFFNILTGSFEIIGAIGMIIGIWVPVVALLAGFILGGTMLVAAFTLIVIAKDALAKAIPSIVLSLISLFIAYYHFVYNI